LHYKLLCSGGVARPSIRAFRKAPGKNNYKGATGFEESP